MEGLYVKTWEAFRELGRIPGRLEFAVVPSAATMVNVARAYTTSISAMSWAFSSLSS